MRGDDKLVRRPSLWIGVLLSAAALLLAGAGAGAGGLLAVAGLIALGTGAYTVATRRPSWAGLAGRRAGAVVTLAACVAVATGVGVYGAAHPVPAAPGARSVVDAAADDLGASASITSGAAENVVPHAASGTALALLSTLPVKGRAPKTGYGRVADFGPAWKDIDRNGCDTRDDILRRDLTGVTARAGTHGCVILTGTLTDPYTGRVIRFVRGAKTSAAVQIDHVVALMNAWQSGAQQIGQARREALANDPLNLLAVDGPSNEAKGDGDAATWLPPSKGVRCAYVARQITVKAKYRLWVTPAERAAMVRILDTCPTQPVATAAALRVRAAVPARPVPAPARPAPAKHAPAPAKPAPAKHAPAPAKPAPAKPAPVKQAPAKPAPAPVRPSVVHPGAFCAPAGARGITAKGTAMACKTKPGDPRLRWRAL